MAPVGRFTAHLSERVADFVVGPTTARLVGKMQRAEARAETAADVYQGTRKAAPTESLLLRPLFRQRMDRAMPMPATEGNTVKVLFDGVESCPAKLAAIDRAQHSVHLGAYEVTGDATSDELAEHLANKVKDGVAARFIYDDFGSKHVTGLVKALRAGGIEVRAWAHRLTEPFRINHSWHKKIQIVDGVEAFTGSHNISDATRLGGTDVLVRYNGKGRLRRPILNTDIHLIGPVVRDLQKVFLRDWAALGRDIDEAEERELRAVNPPAAGSVTAWVVSHDPLRDGDDHTEMLNYLALSHATHRVSITVPYFAPSPLLMDAMMQASKRGVVVELTVPDKDGIDYRECNDLARAHFAQLLAAEVIIYESPEMLHEKNVVIDDCFSIVGSVNWNQRSLKLDAELSVAMLDRAVAAKLLNRFVVQAGRGHRLTSHDLRPTFASRMRAAKVLPFKPVM